MLFATHYLEEADAIADRVLVLHRGRLVADGTAAEIKARAGARRITFDLEGTIEETGAAGAAAGLWVGRSTGRDRSGSGPRDADATIHAVYGLGLYPATWRSPGSAWSRPSSPSPRPRCAVPQRGRPRR